VRVPSEAGEGAAKVTIRIPDWKGPELSPTSFAVPLDDASTKIRVAKPWK
jgi:hypothetical protein